MSYSTITVVTPLCAAATPNLNTTNNTSPVLLTYTLSTTDFADIAQYVQNVWHNGGMFTDSKHWFPISSIQYLDIS